MNDWPADNIERWKLSRLIPYARNARTHTPDQVKQIAASMREWGWTMPVLADEAGMIIAGHARVQAAEMNGYEEAPVMVAHGWSEAKKRAYVLADNRLALNAGWDEELLRGELLDLKDMDLDMALIGFSDDEMMRLLEAPPDESAEAPPEEIAPLPADPVTRPGDLWLVGSHRLICGDCRDSGAIARVLDGARANVVITSPPYASQRAYDPSSGFKPITPEEYATWFGGVAGNIAGILCRDGSYFLNIKEHANEGQRNLYVKKLVIAHVEQWGWRFVDELCWRKTDDGVPGGWGNRFKNAWEPVFHFCRQPEIKFRPKAVGHWSDDCFDYSPNNATSRSGSGLLGCGPRGAAADSGINQGAWQRSRNSLDDSNDSHGGIARPSNVIEAKTENSQGSHSAPFPRALAEFFVKAYSDAGDVIFDPFLGSGTTIAAAHVLGRNGSGCEISPGYCDVILARLTNLSVTQPILAATGQTFNEVAVARGKA